MSKLSVIIPSRQPEYLNKTIEDLLGKAAEDIEIIVVLDGYWSDPPVKEDKRVRLIHFGAHRGMRDAINAGIRIAGGEYIMKTDEHCMFDEGFDRKLKQDCQDDWVVIPRRKRLDAENWKLIEDGRPDIDYMFVSYPYKEKWDRNCGLYGAEWREKGRERKDILIDDTPTMQGSCWFMPKAYFDKLLPGGMNAENYGPFNHEAQEISMTAWLSGGAIKVNKKTWYAHLHKGRGGKGYGFSNQQYRNFCTSKEKARRYAIDYWLITKDYKHDWKWFMEKFPNMPTWSENWEERLKEDAKYDWRNDPSKNPTEWVELDKLSNPIYYL